MAAIILSQSLVSDNGIKAIVLGGPVPSSSSSTSPNISTAISAGDELSHSFQQQIYGYQRGPDLDVNGDPRHLRPPDPDPDLIALLRSHHLSSSFFEISILAYVDIGDLLHRHHAFIGSTPTPANPSSIDASPPRRHRASDHLQCLYNVGDVQIQATYNAKAWISVCSDLAFPDQIKEIISLAKAADDLSVVLAVDSLGVLPFLAAIDLWSTTKIGQLLPFASNTGN